MKKIYPIGFLGAMMLLLGCQKDTDLVTPPPVLTQSADSGVKLTGARAASRERQEALKLTPEQTTKLRELRKQRERALSVINGKYSALMGPYQSAVMVSTRQNKPLDPKVKKEVDAIFQRKTGEMAPLEAKFKAEEQALYTPEQRALLSEFAKKQETK